MQVRKQQLELDMEQQTGSRLGMEYFKAVYCHLLILCAEYLIRNTRLDEAQAGMKIAGRNINNLKYADAAAKLLQLCPTLCDPMDSRQPTRLLCPWGSPGKNTGVGCHFLLPPLW